MTLKCFFIEPVETGGGGGDSRDYMRADTREVKTLGEWYKIPGAMFDAHWYPDEWKGPDGRSLVVTTPSVRPWVIDGVASNCTDRGNTNHRCWTRDGEPPEITVGKEFGPTCKAGAGSILSGDYHGFLRGGVFT